MRFKNFSREALSVPFQAWTHPTKGGLITLSLGIEPGDITDEFDPNDPIVQVMLKAHPELRPVVLATAWERVLAGIL